MTVEWRVEPGITPYADAVAAMETRVAAIRAGEAGELIWLVEHPPLYTAGTGARAADLCDPRLPVIETGRGGRHTYHGPGQRVVYPMLDLASRGRDVHRFVHGLEAWAVAALALLGVTGFAVADRPGVWVATPTGEAKIAAIGVRVRRWVSFHGFAVNVAPDLAHYAGIVPCGLPLPVTSLAALGLATTMADLDVALAATCPTS